MLRHLLIWHNMPFVALVTELANTLELCQSFGHIKPLGESEVPFGSACTLV